MKAPSSAELVFDEEYWFPVSDRRLGLERAASIPREADVEIHALCAMAATDIFSGAPRQTVPDDTKLDCTPQNRYTAPGSVLLADIEWIRPGGQQRKDTNPNSDPRRHSFIRDPEEILAAPAALFRRNTVRMRLPNSEEQVCVFPYAKSAYNSDLEMIYSRYVGLLMYGLDRRGSHIGFLQRHWLAGSSAQVRGYTLQDLNGSRRKVFSEPVIGETYKEPQLRSNGLVRMKSAELCLSGTLEYARSKQKMQRQRAFGRLAIAPSFG